MAIFCAQTPFNKPTDVWVDPKSGDIFITDGYGNSRVHRLKGDGTPILSWGTPGTDPGEFKCVAFPACAKSRRPSSDSSDEIVAAACVHVACRTTSAATAATTTGVRSSPSAKPVALTIDRRKAR